jgi:diguanylate cyclase (GGDEF)-like protein
MTDNVALWRFAFVLPNLLAAFGMVFVAVLAWRFRRHRGGWALWVFAVGASIWAFTEGMTYVGFSPETSLFLWNLGHIGVTSVPLAMAVFTLSYIGYGHLLTRGRLVMLSILPVATLLCAWTNDWHGWYWRNLWVDSSVPFPMLAETHGPFLWIYSAYGILLILTTIAILLRKLSERSQPTRRQIYLVLVAMVLPMLGHMVYMAELTPLTNMDMTPLMFNISGFVLMYAFMRERLFELTPVSVHEIYRSLEDAIFVIDDEGRVQDMNKAARSLLLTTADRSIGVLLPELLPEAGFLLNEAHGDVNGEVSLHGHYYDVRMTLLHSVGGRFSGRMLVWRDVTERKQLESELRRLSVTDALTGLYNRRYFRHRGEDEIKHAQRYGRPLSMIMLDIDYFKDVNDSFGHDAGDRVLVALAALLTSELRETDCIGRIGGEEFALLLPETDEAAAHELCQRVLKAVAAMSVSIVDGRTIGITVSAGMATLEAGEIGISQFMRRTDGAMYQAKNEGRNRLVQCL